MPYEKVGKNEPVCIADEVPFDIPDSWEWVRLKNCCIDIFSGKSPKYIKSETAFHIIGQAANQNTGLDFSQCKYTDADFWNSMDEKYFLRKYDVLLNTLGNGTLGRSGIVTDLPYPTLTDGHLFIFRTNEEVVGWYLYLYLQHRKPEIEKCANGSTNQTFLNLTKTMEWLVPLPSKDEQIRIVEKYKSLTPILEAYSIAYNNCIRLNDTFPELLKKSILQEVVQGKLVSQDPNDEPASVLLERIRAEKQRLIKEGKIKKDKHESVIFRRDNSHYEKLNGIERCIDDEIPFDIPDNWCWCRLGNMIGIQRGASPRPKGSPEYWSKERTKHHWIKISDITKHSDNDYLIDTDEFLTDLGSTKSVFVDEDYLITAASGSLGKIAKLKISGYIYDGLMCMCFKNTSLEKDYIIILIKAMVEYLMSVSTGTAWKNITTDILKNLLVPLPPLNEQKRIIDKVEYLFSMCDSI